MNQVVVRSMIRAGSTIFSTANFPFRKTRYFRRSHVVVVDVETGAIISYILSFSGLEGKARQGGVSGTVVSIDGAKFYSFNGNHPNWIHGTHDINMNIAYNPKLNSPGALRYDVARISFGRGNCSPPLLATNSCPQLRITIEGAYLGSGHSLYIPGSRSVLLDAYAKENKLFPTAKTCNNKNRISVPLRLVDLENLDTTVLVEVPIYWPGVQGAGTGRDEWRCDMHPALSRDARWVAINGRPDGGWRQVMVVYIGTH